MVNNVYKLVRQNFSYHMHTNALGIFDGKNSIYEMIAQAEKLGYVEMGISNHICYHPNMKIDHRMFFTDYNKALDIYQKNVAEIREAAKTTDIKISVGFEVDYFASDEWNYDFERMKKELDTDYLIGATHFFSDDKEENVINIYNIDKHPDIINAKNLEYYLENYWKSIVNSIKSGHFDFIAHLDVVKNFGWCKEEKWNTYKEAVINALIEYNHPYEINTSGITKAGEENPSPWIVEKLCKANVPVIINDDAHHITQIALHFEKIQTMLKDMNYKNFWKLKR